MGLMLNETNLEIRKTKRTSWYLHFCCFAVLGSMTVSGMAIAWTSPVLPKLQSNNTEINPLGAPITTFQASLFAAIPILATTLTYPLWAVLIEGIGSKKTSTISCFFLICGFIATAFAKHAHVYYGSLAITGVGQGGLLIANVSYINDLIDDTNKGKILYFLGLTTPFGLLLTYIIGSFATVKTLTLIFLIPVICFLLLLLFFLPEPPIYLISKKDIVTASSVIEKLRGTISSAGVELEVLKFQQILKNKSDNKLTILDVFRHPLPRRAYFIGFGAFLLQQFSGVLSVLAFAAPIFNQAGTDLSGNTVSIIIGTVSVTISFLGSYFVGKFGTKILLLLSSFFCMIPTFGLALYFYLLKLNPNIINNIRWISIVFVIAFFISYGIGIGPIPVGISSEYFPAELRPHGLALICISAEAVSCIFAFGFLLLAESIGLYWCFWIHNIFSLSCMVWMYFYLPNNRGKTTVEVQEELLKK